MSAPQETQGEGQRAPETTLPGADRRPSAAVARGGLGRHGASWGAALLAALLTVALAWWATPSPVVLAAPPASDPGEDGEGTDGADGADEKGAAPGSSASPTASDAGASEHPLRQFERSIDDGAGVIVNGLGSLLFYPLFSARLEVVTNVSVPNEAE